MEPSLTLAVAPVRYARHQPKTTLLYQLVERHYPDFLAALGQRDRHLPDYVQDEFEAYLKCGRLEYGSLRVRCTTCHAERLVAFSCNRRGFCPSCGARRITESAALLVDEVLAIVYRVLASQLIKKAGLTLTTGQTGAVTLIQRFGTALNLYIHFHMLCLDAILRVITTRLARHLERRGLLVRDAESSHLTRAPGEDAALEILQGHSITYRIAVGPHEGRTRAARPSRCRMRHVPI